jgi:ankyrin repeat protein
MDTGVGTATYPPYPPGYGGGEEIEEDDPDLEHPAVYDLWEASRKGDGRGVWNAFATGGINHENIDKRFGNGRTTALFEAVSRVLSQDEDYDMSVEIARVLIFRGANPSTYTGKGSTPLHAVVENLSGTHTLNIIIEQCPNLNLNVRDGNGRTPLLSSMLHSQFPWRDRDMETLLEHGADPSIPDSQGSTILHYGPSLFILNMVLDGPIPIDINARDNHGRTALFRLIQMTDWSKTDRGNSAGIIILKLMERGADPRIRNHAGYTVLHLRSNKTVLLGILNNHNHIDINVRNNKGQTPLHTAMAYNNIDAVDVLIAHGSDINRKDDSGKTPLHTAVAYNNIDAVDVLIAHGSDINRKDDSGKTPLDWANRQGGKMQEMIHHRVRKTAFLMGHHARLGENSLVRLLPEDLIHREILNYLTP